MRELSDTELKRQLASFREYERRGGRFSLEKWLAVKDFTRGDRDALLSMVNRTK